MQEARRQSSRALQRFARRARRLKRAWLRRVALVGLVLLVPFPVAAETITAARYAEPTIRYPHGVLGDTTEHGSLLLETDAGRTLRIRLPDARVFEDTEPRLADLDGDGAPEVITVESHVDRGSRLAVYGTGGLIGATDWIGRRFRWLAPLGVADLDGDGRMELAYVDRPHLARTLRIVRLDGARLVGAAALGGVTNHRIGDKDISGGIRDCGEGPEMIVSTPDWTRLLSVVFREGRLAARDIGPLNSAASFSAALRCEL